MRLNRVYGIHATLHQHRAGLTNLFGRPLITLTGPAPGSIRRKERVRGRAAAVGPQLPPIVGERTARLRGDRSNRWASGHDVRILSTIGQRAFTAPPRRIEQPSRRTSCRPVKEYGVMPAVSHPARRPTRRHAVVCVPRVDHVTTTDRRANDIPTWSTTSHRLGHNVSHCSVPVPRPFTTARPRQGDSSRPAPKSRLRPSALWCAILH